MTFWQICKVCFIALIVTFILEIILKISGIIAIVFLPVAVWLLFKIVEFGFFD